MKDKKILYFVIVLIIGVVIGNIGSNIKNKNTVNLGAVVKTPVASVPNDGSNPLDRKTKTTCVPSGAWFTSDITSTPVWSGGPFPIVSHIISAGVIPMQAGDDCTTIAL